MKNDKLGVILGLVLIIIGVVVSINAGYWYGLFFMIWGIILFIVFSDIDKGRQ